MLTQCKIYDAEGRLVAMMDPTTRVRTPVEMIPDSPILEQEIVDKDALAAALGDGVGRPKKQRSRRRSR